MVHRYGGGTLLCFIGVIVFSIVPTIDALCSTFELNDWQTIRAKMGFRNYPNLFGALEGGTGNCSVATLGSYRQKYDCTPTTLAQKLSTDLSINCVSDLNAYLYNGPEWTVSRADEIADICATSVTNFWNYYACNPNSIAGCPDGFQVTHFAPFVGCLSGVTASMTSQQVTAYYTSGSERTCIHNSMKASCKKWATWSSCPVQVKYITQQYNYNCTYVFQGSIPPPEFKCNQTFSEVYPYYCYTDWWEENYQWVIAASVLVPWMLIMAVFLYKMRGRFFHIGEKEILGDDYDLIKKGIIPNTHSSVTSMGFSHPEAHVVALRVAARSKFKGVEYDPELNVWFVLENSQKKAFQGEKEAATYAYQQTARIHLEPQSPSRVMSEEEIKQKRIEELVEFYEYWDRDKPDIRRHVENLFDRHDIEHIARAVKTKYGLLPVSWENDISV